MRTLLREARRLGITSPLDAIATAKNFAVTAWEPTRSDIEQGVNLLLRGELARLSETQVAEYELSHPVLADYFRSGYDPELDPSRLLHLPEGTLGREYARMILRENLDPLGTLLAFGTPRNTVHYAMRRAYKLHDVMHIVLGCDTSVLGEIRIVAFSLGQSLATKHSIPGATSRDARGSVSAAMAYAVLVLHLALRRPLGELGEAIRLGAEWVTLGERSPDHIEFRIEEMMDRPVEEVRRAVLGLAA